MNRMPERRPAGSGQAALLRLFARARLPLMVAPMFLVSGPELVCACLGAGVIGSYAAPNARDIAALDAALARISEQAARCGGRPWALNMIVHSSYDRFEAELELVRRYRPAIVSTALGSPARVLEAVRGYGGQVLADVISPAMARKALAAGVDGLQLVSGGAGGHTGRYHPFAFLAEVRRFWTGPLGLAGAISSGAQMRAAQLVGADFVVMGTRFIATEESMATAAYRALLVESGMEDLELSSAVSGVAANWLKPTLDAAGFTPEQLQASAKIDFSGDIIARPKAWKDVWSAGHGVGAVDAVAPLATVVAALEGEYLSTLREEAATVHALLARYGRQAWNERG